MYKLGKLGLKGKLTARLSYKPWTVMDTSWHESLSELSGVVHMLSLSF